MMYLHDSREYYLSVACPTKRVPSKSGSRVMDSSSRVSQFLAKSLSYNPIKLINVFPYSSHFAISAPLNSLYVWGERGGRGGGGRLRGHPFDC